MRFQFAGERRKQRIVTQRIVIVQVFIAQRQTEQPLPQQRRQAVFDERRIAPVDEAASQTINQLQPLVDPAQEQGPRVAGQRAAIETRLDPPLFRLSKIKPRRVTLRVHRGHREPQRKCL